MPERLLAPATYVKVLAILLVLTVLTSGVSFAHFSGLGHVTAGLAIAIVKASLVVLFFMHAAESSRVTWAVIVVTLFWLIAVLMVLTFSDYATRELIPNMPGH